MSLNLNKVFENYKNYDQNISLNKIKNFLTNVVEIFMKKKNDRILTTQNIIEKKKNVTNSCVRSSSDSFLLLCCCSVGH